MKDKEVQTVKEEENMPGRGRSLCKGPGIKESKMLFKELKAGVETTGKRPGSGVGMERLGGRPHRPWKD